MKKEGKEEWKEGRKEGRKDGRKEGNGRKRYRIRKKNRNEALLMNLKKPTRCCYRKYHVLAKISKPRLCGSFDSESIRF